MNHTPGPWITKNGTTIKAVSHGKWFTVARAETRGFNPDGVTANARLIAAAPDLLEAIQGLFEHCAMIHKHWGEGDNTRESGAAKAKALAAIAKATVQS